MSRMFQTREAPVHNTSRRVISVLIWLSLAAGLAVSLFTVIEELCLATACRDTAGYTFFGVGLGWFGIAYFSTILILLWMRNRYTLLHWVVAVLIYCGVGAEIRLLWIQKFIIGSWCPLCVSICGALFLAAAALCVEMVQDASSDKIFVKSFFGWMLFVASMMMVGLLAAFTGVAAI